MCRTIFLIILSVVLAVACSDSVYSPEANEHDTTNQFLMSNFIESCASSEAVEIREDYNIVGTIITSDSSSNFYNTFIIDDGSAAIEVLCGFYDVYTNYKIGYKVRIYLKGLSFAQNYLGVYQLGLGSSSVYDVEYFYHRAIAEDYIEVVDTFGSITITEKTIPEVGYDDIARTVKICGLQLCQDDGVEYWAKSDYGSVCEARFHDSYGDTISVKTSSYATFANTPIPTEKVDITALVFWEGSNKDEGYYLKLNDEDAVQVQ